MQVEKQGWRLFPASKFQTAKLTTAKSAYFIDKSSAGWQARLQPL